MHKHHDHIDDAHNNLTPGRLEAFSDGVLAIIITITVLELKVPHGQHLSDLKPLLPLFVTYLISFQNIGMYWNNHHHLLKATNHVSGGIMWANLHLLFWLSLIPFTTGWLGENHGGEVPTALFAGVLLLSAIAYAILQRAVLHHAPNRAELLAVFDKSKKGTVSLILYALAIPLAFINPIISDVLIVLVSLIWFVPDRRIEMFL